MKDSKRKGGTKAQRRATHAERIYSARRKLRIHEASGTKQLSVDPDKLISKLPKMPLIDTVGLFYNCVRTLASPQNPSFYESTERVLNAIDREWARRTRERTDNDGFFKWPSTEAPGGDGQLFAFGWPEEGLLSLMGYHVGHTNGVEGPIRRELLARVFFGQLPPFISPTYMLEWAQPGTALRLKKIAETIAALTRNAKRRRSFDFADAIGDWEDDLRFLYEKYYVGHFGFAWPSSELP